MIRAWCMAVLRSSGKAVVVSAVLCISLYGYARLGAQAGYTGTVVAQRPAPPLTLETDGERPFSLSSQRGHIVLVYFGYTQCPDVCPTTLASLSAVLEQLGRESKNVSVVFVTLDPAHDTSQRLAAYLGAFSPRPLGLTGTPDQVADAARAWGIKWRRTDDGRFIDHTSVITAVDPGGNVRLQYGFEQLTHPVGIANDLRRILQQSGDARS